MYLCIMIRRTTSINSKIDFTIQQKIITNLCYKLLFNLVINKEIKMQTNGFQFIKKIAYDCFFGIFTVTSPCSFLLFTVIFQKAFYT